MVNYLSTNQYLLAPGTMTSPGGVYTLALGTDAVFWVGVPWLNIWGSKSESKSGDYYLLMQSDGNLYITEDKRPCGRPILTAQAVTTMR